MTSDANQVRIIEVSPRDGLQNEPGTVSTTEKIALINGLVGAGAREIEIGSFVAPKWVPQMSDTVDVVTATRDLPGLQGIALVPNLKGLERAIEAGVKRIAIFPAATESFSNKNLNASMNDSISSFEEVARVALNEGIAVRGYVSVAFHCPFDGWVEPRSTVDVVNRLMDFGCYEVSICDTTGKATPGHVMPVLEPALGRHGPTKVVAHFHDTYGQGLANVLQAWRGGIAAFDASTGGLGGCPYSPGATGNVATEELIYMFEGLGVSTGLDLSKILDVAREIYSSLNRDSRSSLMNG